MPAVKNSASGALQFHHQDGKRLTLKPGVNELSESDFNCFSKEIKGSKHCEQLEKLCDTPEKACEVQEEVKQSFKKGRKQAKDESLEQVNEG